MPVIISFDAIIAHDALEFTHKFAQSINRHAYILNKAPRFFIAGPGQKQSQTYFPDRPNLSLLEWIESQDMTLVFDKIPGLLLDYAQTHGQRIGRADVRHLQSNGSGREGAAFPASFGRDLRPGYP